MRFRLYLRMVLVTSRYPHSVRLILDGERASLSGKLALSARTTAVIEIVEIVREGSCSEEGDSDSVAKLYLTVLETWNARRWVCCRRLLGIKS